MNSRLKSNRTDPQSGPCEGGMVRSRKAIDRSESLSPSRPKRLFLREYELREGVAVMMGQTVISDLRAAISTLPLRAEMPNLMLGIDSLKPSSICGRRPDTGSLCQIVARHCDPSIAGQVVHAWCR